MFIDEFGGGGRGYVAVETTNIDAGDWRPSSNFKMPKGAKHGTVIPM